MGERLTRRVPCAGQITRAELGALPTPLAERKCTDVAFCGLFVIGILGTLVIAGKVASGLTSDSDHLVRGASGARALHPRRTS